MSTAAWTTGCVTPVSSTPGSQQVLAHFEYPVTAERPQLPEGLVWAVQEPLWMEIADARLARGLTSFTLEIRDMDDFGVRRFSPLP